MQSFDPGFMDLLPIILGDLIGGGVVVFGGLIRQIRFINNYRVLVHPGCGKWILEYNV